MRILIILVLSIIVSVNCNSQSTGYIPFSKPVSPTAYQFLKYTEMPINTYTGIAGIDIPIFTVQTKNIKIPLSITYHGGGIRVAEEASWIGLGWDLQVGNIVQMVNDRDDLGTDQRVLPDYYNYFYPYTFCERTLYPQSWPPSPPTCFTASTGIDQEHPKHSFVTYTDFTFPINGSYDNRNQDFFNSSYDGQLDEIDSEPDIFKVNLFGDSFVFVIDFTTGNIKVLDNKGYMVTLTQIENGQKGIKVISPDGTTYEFNSITESKILSSTSVVRNVEFVDGTQSLTSRVFQISKITDIDNKQITFNWSAPVLINDLPGFSQTYKKMTSSDVSREYECFYGRRYFKESRNCSYGGGCSGGIEGLNPNSTVVDLGFSYSYMQEGKVFLSSIVFPEGQVVFNTSSRSDIYNDKRLESIEVRNLNNTLIRNVQFKHSYFVGVNQGMGYDKETTHVVHHGKSEEELVNRLRLDSLVVSGEGPYVFTYNNDTLPSKASYATDYWGYYNGKLTNQSLIPNPVRFNLPALGDNGNDHDSDLDYIVAGSLEKIKYPTKGERYFIYELNSFTNSQIATINYGNGLRIKETGTIDEGNTYYRKIFNYEGGKLITPMKIYENYYFDQCKRVALGDGNYYDDFTNISTWQINSGNFYSSSCLGSGNCIGYDKVTTIDLGQDGQPSGKLIEYFHNNFDLIDQTLIPFNLGLPARKDETKVDNGLIYKSEIYKEGNQVPLQITENQYSDFQISEVFYGAKSCFNTFFSMSIQPFNPNPLYPCDYYLYSLNTIGYFPIYTGHNLLKQKTIIENAANGVPVTNIAKYFYDNKDNLIELSQIRSDGNEDIEYYYYPYSQEIMNNPYMSNLRIQNRINHKIKTENFVYNNTELQMYPVSGTLEKYDLFGDFTNLKEFTKFTYNIYTPQSSYSENNTIIDSYDNNNNILQYHRDGGITESFKYGYDYKAIIASARNATFPECDHTGFENYESVGFQISGGLSITGASGKQFTGKLALGGIGGVCGKTYCIIPDVAKSHSGYMASVWVKGSSSAYLRIQVGEDWSTQRDIYNSADADEWNLLKVELPRAVYENINPSGCMYLKVYFGSDEEVCFDDFRFQPIDSQMETYTYEPLIGLTSKSDINNKPSYYEYDFAGRLITIKDYKKDIRVKNVYHFSEQ